MTVMHMFISHWRLVFGLLIALASFNSSASCVTDDVGKLWAEGLLKSLRIGAPDVPPNIVLITTVPRQAFDGSEWFKKWASDSGTNCAKTEEYLRRDLSRILDSEGATMVAMSDPDLERVLSDVNNVGLTNLDPATYTQLSLLPVNFVVRVSSTTEYSLSNGFMIRDSTIETEILQVASRRLRYVLPASGRLDFRERCGAGCMFELPLVAGTLRTARQPGETIFYFNLRINNTARLDRCFEPSQSLVGFGKPGAFTSESVRIVGRRLFDKPFCIPAASTKAFTAELHYQGSIQPPGDVCVVPKVNSGNVGGIADEGFAPLITTKHAMFFVGTSRGDNFVCWKL